MVESNEVQIQYKGKVYSITVEHDNSLKLEKVKTIDPNAVGVAHYNTGDAFRRNVLADPKGNLRTKNGWRKNARLIIRDTVTKKPVVIDD